MSEIITTRDIIGALREVPNYMRQGHAHDEYVDKYNNFIKSMEGLFESVTKGTKSVICTICIETVEVKAGANCTCGNIQKMATKILKDT